MTQLLLQQAFDLGKICHALEEEKVALLKENALLKHQFEGLKVVLPQLLVATRESTNAKVQEIVLMTKSLCERLEGSMKEVDAKCASEQWHRAAGKTQGIYENLNWIKWLSSALDLASFRVKYGALDDSETPRYNELLTQFHKQLFAPLQRNESTILTSGTMAPSSSAFGGEDHIGPLAHFQRKIVELETEITLTQADNTTLKERIEEFNSQHSSLINFFKTTVADALSQKTADYMTGLQNVKSNGMRVQCPTIIKTYYYTVTKNDAIPAEDGLHYIETDANLVELPSYAITGEKTWLRWRALEFFQQCEEIQSQVNVIVDKIHELRN